MDYLPFAAESLKTDPLDNFRSTTDTIHKMIDVCMQSVDSPLVVNTAQEIALAIGGSNRSDIDIIRACFWWTKHHMKFQEDEAILINHFGVADLEDGKELLLAPTFVLQMIEMEKRGIGAGAIGDCDDFSMMLATLLKQFRIPLVAFCTIAADKNNPDGFTHVYCKVRLADGSVMPLDASHGMYPGWEAPQYFKSLDWWF